jgi:hypothetical protein
MLNRSVIFSAGLILSQLPSVALAQTKPSWQEWSKQNPTYPSAPAASPAPNSTPAASWSNNSASAGDSTATGDLYNKGFMKGCTESGAPQALCSCALDSLRSRFTLAQLMNMFKQGGTPPSVLEEIATSCLAKTN